MLRKKRNADSPVFYYANQTNDIVIENQVFRLKDKALMAGNNQFSGLSFFNCANIKIRNCTFIDYTKEDTIQARAIGLSGGNSGVVDVQYCTFIGCGYGMLVASGTYNELIFDNNVFSEPMNISSTSMENDARMIFFNSATFTNFAKVRKNRWQSVEGMGGDVVNTLSATNVIIEENQFLGFVDSTLINTLSNGGGTIVLGDNSGFNQVCQKNVIVNTSSFGIQAVGEGEGANINCSFNKVLIELKDSPIGRSEMAIQMQNCYPDFVFEHNRARGYRYTGAEQSIFAGEFYNTCPLYDPVVLKAQNKDNDHTLTKEKIIASRIL